MKPNQPYTQADCTVEFQVFNPDTNEQTWEVYESMTIQAPTIETLVERAHLYVGRPERHENVAAIRLTGTMSLIDQEKHWVYDHQDTIKLDLHVLRERTIPLSSTGDIASGQ